MTSELSQGLLQARPSSQPSRGLRALLHTGFFALVMFAVLLSGLAFTATTPAAAQDEIGVSGLPATSSGEPDGRSSFSFSADPGDQFTDHYLVRNAGTLPQSFTVLGADAFNDDAGAYALRPTKEEPIDLGAWVSFENGANKILFELQPGESRLVPFTITVPENATPGDHAGGIVASVVSPDGQVLVDRRVAARTYVRVSGDIQVHLSVSRLEGTYSGDWWNPLSGKLTMTYTVENTGNIALASNVRLGVSTWFGIPLDNQTGDSIPELLPGNSRSYQTEATGIAALIYLNPWVTLSPYVESSDPSKLLVTQPTTRDTFVFAVPWLLVILLALIALFFGFRRWRRKIDRKRAEEWVKYTESEARRKIEAEQDQDAIEVGGTR